MFKAVPPPIIRSSKLLPVGSLSSLFWIVNAEYIDGSFGTTSTRCVTQKSEDLLKPRSGKITVTSELIGRLRLKCDGTRTETRFRLSAKRTSPFKSAGTSV